MEREVTQVYLNEIEEICYNDGYEIDDIQDAMAVLADDLVKEMSHDYEPDILKGVKFIEYQIKYKQENNEYDVNKPVEFIDNGMPDDCTFYEAKQYLNSKGYILVEAKSKDNSLYTIAKDRIKKEKQKYVPQLEEVNGLIDAKSFQDYLCKVLKRKINFHTNPKGGLFWEITDKEYNKLPVRVPLIAYNVEYNLYGRNSDKWRIPINSTHNKTVFDTSCWNKNIRAYRAGIAEEANPDMVKLATIVMRAYNKVPKYVNVGKIFKSRIMEIEPNWEWHTIGSTLDLDCIEAMGVMLKRENELNNVNVETGKKGFPSVNITFDFWNYKVEIQAMVAPLYCRCEMRVKKV